VTGPAGRAFATIVPLASLACSCGPVTDVVFQVPAVTVNPQPVHVREGSGVWRAPLRLASPARERVSADFELRELEAQDGCQVPDFAAARGTVEWAPGEIEASVEVWIGDDDLAETDERFAIDLTWQTGASGSAELDVVIDDDDRTALIDAGSQFGVEAGTGRDVTLAIQSALDAAAAGRGVVVFEPGDYEVSSVTISQGTTISAKGATWHRPAQSPANTVTLRLGPATASAAGPVLVEGLAIDGRRDAQGEFRNYELGEAHLISMYPDPSLATQQRVSLEDLSLRDGTGDGVELGTNVDAVVCALRGTDVWRDLLNLRGGGSRLRVRDVDASGHEGTTGVWFGPSVRGHDGSLFFDLEAEDIRLGTGDLEIDARDGSRAVLRRITMTRPPLHITAPDATVRIYDSVLQVGIPVSRQNYWFCPHDVEVVRTTLSASTRIGESDEPPTDAQTVILADVRWALTETDPPVPGEHRLLFDQCRFDAASDVRPIDTVYGVQSPGPGGIIVVRASELGPRLSGWFAPTCIGCGVEP
jgi:Calx-beta domain